MNVADALLEALRSMPYRSESGARPLLLELRTAVAAQDHEEIKRLTTTKLTLAQKRAIVFAALQTALQTYDRFPENWLIGRKDLETFLAELREESEDV